MIGACALKMLSKRSDHTLFAASLKNIEKALEKANAPKGPPNLTKLPLKYAEFAHLFFVKEFDKLPTYRVYDHSIELQPGTTPPSGPLYKMSHEKLQVLHQYFKDNLKKGFI